MAKSNKITGANAGGPRQVTSRTRWAARVAQFCRSAMKGPLFIVALLACASCSTGERQRTEIESERTVAVTQVVSLPRLTVAGVTFDDGLQEQEAAVLSHAYFHRFVSGCGMPDKPQDDSQYWRVQLWGRYIAVDYGTLRLAKDGSEVVLQSPSRGFRSATRSMLKHQNLRYE